MFDAIDV
jgi:hypothetical protein